jgi:pSer/pThr/pTyr-binding forkhead associated (FHA) protein
VLVEEWLEGGIGGRAYLRTGPSITVGRSGCSINLGEDPYLSQAHAEIVVEAEGAAKLRDLGSSNGTFVRVPPGSECELHHGDTVRIGREVLRVEVG